MPTTDPHDDDPIGQVLDGRYRIIGRVGEGGMGSVYRAERVNLGRIVAVKMMSEKLPPEMASRRRFEREAVAMAKLEHPHCAAVLDVGTHDERPFVVMDFVSGQDLVELLIQGPVPIPRAVEIMRQVLSGLAHAHEHGIVHRDIKPANIVLSHKAGLGDHAKILDFGLAHLDNETSNLTAGVIVGTPSYMAPEQIRGQLVDARADLYACGVLLYELLTNVKPFRTANKDPVAICMLHINEPAPKLSDGLPGVDFGQLEAIVARALEKDRDRRWKTAVEFAGALLAAVGRTNFATPPVGVPAQEPTAWLPETALQSLPPDASMPPRVTPRRDPSVPSTPPPIPPPRAKPQRGPSRRGLAIAGGAVIAVLVVVAIVVAATGSKPSVPADAAVAAIEPDAESDIEPPPVDDDAGEVVVKAEGLIAKNRRDVALKLLLNARKAHANDARIPLLAAKIYLARFWYRDGLQQARAALALDPMHKNDRELIELALKCYLTTPGVDYDLSRFLRTDIGEPAKKLLEDAATKHPNPLARTRAKAELARF